MPIDVVVSIFDRKTNWLFFKAPKNTIKVHSVVVVSGRTQIAELCCSARDLDHDIDAEKLYFSNYGTMLFLPILILNFAEGKIAQRSIARKLDSNECVARELAVKLMQSTAVVLNY